VSSKFLALSSLLFLFTPFWSKQNCALLKELALENLIEIKTLIFLTAYSLNKVENPSKNTYLILGLYEKVHFSFSLQASEHRCFRIQHGDPFSYWRKK